MNHGGSGKTIGGGLGQGLAKGRTKVAHAGCVREPAGRLAGHWPQGRKWRGRGVSPGPLSGAQMGALPLLTAPGQITSTLLAPLQDGHSHSELHRLVRVTGRSLRQVGTVWGAVRM